MPRQKMSPSERRTHVVYLDEATARRLRVMAAGLGCPAGEAVARMLCLAERVAVVPVRPMAKAGADPEVAP
jgi:hypothetical protein